MIFFTLSLVALNYFQTALRFLWTADAGDIITAAYQYELAHPPGYPLYIFFLKAFFLLPFKGDAFKTSLLSVASSLICLFLIYKTCELILKQTVKHIGAIQKAIMHISVLVCSLIPLWWLYSGAQEVFMVTAAFVCLINYLSVLLVCGGFSKKRIIIYALVLSLAVFHQYVIALICLPAAFVFFKLRKKFDAQTYVIVFLSFLAGFIPYLLFLKNSPEYSLWFSTNSVTDLIYIALRLNYGPATVFGKNIFMSSLSDRLASLLYYAEVVFQSFHILLFFVAVGIIYLFKNVKVRFLAWLFFAQFVLSGPILSILYPLSAEVIFNRVIFERFVLLSFPALFVFLFYGFYSLWVFFKRFNKTFRAQFVYLFIIALIPVLLWIKNFEYFRTIAHDATIQQLGERTLRFLPRNSLFIVNSDIIYFPVDYASTVLKIRPDVVVISQQMILDRRRRQSRQKWLEDRAIVLPKKYDAHFFENFVKLNAKKRPVMSSFSIHGSNIFTQVGPSYVYTGTVPLVDYEKAKQFFKGLSMQDYSQGNRIKPYGIMEAERFFSKAANFYAKHWFLKTDYLKSIQFAHISLDMYLSRETMYFLGGLYYKIHDCENAREIWKKSYFQFVDLEAVTQLKNLELVCFKNKDRAAFWLYIEKRMKSK